VDISNHGTNITSRILLLDCVDIVLGWLIEIFHVTFIDGIDLATTWKDNLKTP
jgi:hypothetical protein